LHLHARQLIIPHPHRGIIEVTAPLGPEMRKTWTWFGFDANARTRPQET
jgi:23S rRNA pseudouridine955/2504/2580 synthase